MPQANFIFSDAAFHHVDYRHAVVDDLSPYLHSGIFNPAQPAGDVSAEFGIETSFDLQTIIYDVDGTLTGVKLCAGTSTITNAVSSNTFTARPGNVGECSAIGSQTSTSQHVNLFVWNLNDFGLPLYRQWLVDEDVYGPGGKSVKASDCGSPCASPDKRGCARGTYMQGPQSSKQQTSLVASGGTYYVDLSAGLVAGVEDNSDVPESCLLRALKGQTVGGLRTKFVDNSNGNQFRMSLNYGRRDTKIELQMFVGKNLATGPTVEFHRVSFHTGKVGEPADRGQDTIYESACDASSGCNQYTASTGILSIHMDYTLLPQEDFDLTTCLPSALCKMSNNVCVPDTAATLGNYPAAASRVKTAGFLCEYATKVGSIYREEPKNGSLAAYITLSDQSLTQLLAPGATFSDAGIAPDAEPNLPNQVGFTSVDSQCAAAEPPLPPLLPVVASPPPQPPSSPESPLPPSPLPSPPSSPSPPAPNYPLCAEAASCGSCPLASFEAGNCCEDNPPTQCNANSLQNCLNTPDFQVCKLRT